MAPVLTKPVMESSALTPRIRRLLELAYAVEGVAEARVWQWDRRVAIGVRPTLRASADVLSRVQQAVAALREPDEAWDFGYLDLAN